MQVSISTLVYLTRNAELQSTVKKVLGSSVDAVDFVLTQSDVDAIGAEFDRYSTLLENATLNELDPSSSSIDLFASEPEGEENKALRLSELRHEARSANYAAKELFIELVRLLGLELPACWRE